MHNHDDDHKIFRTFEEFEREEIRRADSVGNTVDGLFDSMFTDELDLEGGGGARLALSDYGDDEE